MVDGQGTTVRLESPARRIVILYGAFGEILTDMGLNERIVARTKADASTPELAHLPSVGTHMRPSIEMVVGLEPDLVLQLSGRKAAAQTVKDLRAHGLKVAAFSPSSFKELFAAIRTIGVLTDAYDAAQSLVESMQGRLAVVAGAVEELSHTPRVFFEVRGVNLLAAGQGGIVNDIITHAGGVNAIRNERKIVRLGDEAVYELDPDCYIVQQGPMNKNPVPPRNRPLYVQLRAVKNDRVLMVDEHLFSRPGPRSVLAVEQLARFLHDVDLNRKEN